MLTQAIVFARNIAGNTDSVTIDAGDFTGRTILRGGGGHDVLIGGQGAQSVFYVSGGADRMTSTASGAALYVGQSLAGDWTVRDGSGGAGGDILVTKNTGAQDILQGHFSEIRLAGDDGANRFDASGLTRANVLLFGNGSNDTLLGGGGDDTLSGGAGHDVFHGGGGSNLLIEKEFRAYDLTDAGLYHDSAGDTAYRLDIALPDSSQVADSFRLRYALPDGTLITTAALSFSASTADIQATIQALRIVDSLGYDLTLTRNAEGRITHIRQEFDFAFGGRDLNIGVTVFGTHTPAGGSATAFSTVVTPVIGTRSVPGREALTNIQRVQFSFEAEMPGWADLAGFSGAAHLIGSNRDDIVRVGANHSVALGSGDDQLTVVAAGAFDPDTIMLDGGAGCNRLVIAGQSRQILTDTYVSFSTDTAQRVAHAGFQDFHLIGTEGNDILDASGLISGALSAATLIETLNNGAGLPIRSGDNDNMQVVTRDANGDAQLSTADTGARSYDLKVIHPNGDVSRINIPGAHDGGYSGRVQCGCRSECDNHARTIHRHIQPRRCRGTAVRGDRD
jgi:Ca2+-binding RTX toxin-like protein